MATLYEAARKAGIQFADELAPVERRFDTGELELGYLDWGPEDAPPVILLHGFAQNAHSWDYTALALAQKVPGNQPGRTRARRQRLGG